MTAAFGKAAYKTAGDFAQGKYEDAVKACGGSTNCAEADKWKDGGLYRSALHAAIGAISFGTAGATGNLAGSLALNAMDKVLASLNITDATAQNVLKNLAVTIAGVAAGGTGGAAAAFNADANNRQLHPIEIDIIKREAVNFALQLKGSGSVTQTEIDAAEARLAQEAFRIVQFGAPGAADPASNAFLHQPQFRVQLPADANQLAMGIGYAFYATPEQRANPNMYADLIVGDPAALNFYAKNRITQPSPAQAAAAIKRYQQGRDTTELLTKLAGLFSATISLAPVAPVAITACLANIQLCAISAAEMAAGPALGPTGTGVAAMLASRAGVKGVLTSSEANAEWIAIKAGNTAAWQDGAVVLVGDVGVGTRMRMYVNREQADLLRDGKASGLGGWATFDSAAASSFQIRQQLALTQDFKSTAGGLFVVELEVTRSMPANLGFVGLQPGVGAASGEPSKYVGGGTQILLKDFANRGNYLRVVSPPKCLEGC